MGDLREGFQALRARAAELWRSKQLKRLRWVLIIGTLVRLILAPITSWGIDTPDFILSGIDLIYTGSPYSSALYFNPPLGPLLSAPLYALVASLMPFSSLLPTYDSITPAVLATGLTSNLVPSPAALLALKLPLIMADIASTLVIFQLVARFRGARPAELVAGLWFLNPLLIWSTAVHGEVDGLATLFIVLFIAAVVYDWPVVAGVALALGIFAKAYPVALVPLGVLVFLMRPAAPGTPRRARFLPVAWFAAGLALGILPLIIYVAPIVQSLAGGSASGVYGGLSVLIIFNGATPTFPAPLGALQTRSLAPGFLLALRVVAGIGFVATLGFYWWNRRAAAGPRGPPSVPLVATAALWTVICVVLLDSSPQSENMVGPLALVLLAAPLLGRAGGAAYAVLSAAAFGLYMALLTPLAYFYPLAVLLGPGAVDYVNGVAIGYANSAGPLSQGNLWLLAGLVGGTTLLFLWGWSAWRLYRAPRLTEAA